MIGLDIGTHSIKAVQLEKTGDKFSLFAAGITQSPIRGVASDNEADLLKIAETIKKLIMDAKMTEKNANLSIPESQVFTRLISLPSLTDQEVASAIAWQAEPYVPIPIDQASLDYQIVSRRPASPDASQGGVDVLLVAAPKKLVEKYAKIATLAGLNPANIETELLALTRCLAQAQGTAIIVDLGATSTDLAIASNGQLLATRSIATGGNVLTRAVSASLSIHPAQAEEYKKAYGLSSKALEGKVRSALEPAFRVIVEEMKKAMQYYKTELGRQDQIQAIILSGGSAGMLEMVSYLAENLGLEVVIGDPTAKLVRDARLTKSFLAYAPLYAVSMGLALNF